MFTIYTFVSKIWDSREITIPEMFFIWECFKLHVFMAFSHTCESVFESWDIFPTHSHFDPFSFGHKPKSKAAT
jgi:hypothetical protein